VRQRTLSWSFEPSNKFVLVEFSILNPLESGEPLDSVYVGLYSELASIDKSLYATFPPSGSEVFSKKDIDYVDTLRLVEEHHYLSASGGPYSWDGIKFLGATAQDTLAGLKRFTSFHWFTYDPSDTTRDTDPKRYRVMADDYAGGPPDHPGPPSGVEALEQCERTTRDPTTCDPVEVISHGPYRLAPGESLVVAFGFIGGDNEQDLQKNAQAAQKAYDLGYRVPQPPPSPAMVLAPDLDGVTVRWERSPESFRDKSRNDHQMDFEGYRVYISEDGLHYDEYREADLVDSLGFNTGLTSLVDPHPVVYRTVTVTDPSTGTNTVRMDSTYYALHIAGLKPGFRYWVAVTAYDIGDPLNNVGSLESGITQNATVAVPGPTQAQTTSGGGPLVFPNPYKGSAVWDGQFSRDKLLWFANLPPTCTIKIYTLPGDLVQTIEFDASTYHGENSRLLTGQSASATTSNRPPQLSGTMAAWNMISSSEQEISSGLYLFSVTDHATGKVSTGHFVVSK
jgi:hypothetical protein